MSAPASGGGGAGAPPPPEEAAPREAAAAVDLPPPGHAAPRHAPSTEVTWLVALAAGFGGVLAGLLVGGLLRLPGLCLPAAAGALAPLWLAHRRGGRPVLAAFAAVAWAVGGIGAFAAWSLEVGARALVAAVPLGRLYLSAVPLEGRSAEGPGALAGALAAFLLVVGSARLAAGLPALLGLAWGLCLCGARAGAFVAGAVPAGWDPASAALAGAPPQHLGLLLGALLAAPVVARPGPLLPGLRHSRPERRLLAAGLALGAAALLLGPWIDLLWRRLLPG